MFASSQLHKPWSDQAFPSSSVMLVDTSMRAKEVEILASQCKICSRHPHAFDAPKRHNFAQRRRLARSLQVHCKPVLRGIQTTGFILVNMVKMPFNRLHV